MVFDKLYKGELNRKQRAGGHFCEVSLFFRSSVSCYRNISTTKWTTTPSKLCILNVRKRKINFCQFSLTLSIVPCVWSWQQRGLHWDVPDDDQKRGHHRSGIFILPVRGCVHCAETQPCAKPCDKAQHIFEYRCHSRTNISYTRVLLLLLQRKDFPSNSFYVVVVVKTEDEACGGPLRFYPLRPDELIDAGNRTKILDVLVSPAINCELSKYRMLSLLLIYLTGICRH